MLIDFLFSFPTRLISTESIAFGCQSRNEGGGGGDDDEDDNKSTERLHNHASPSVDAAGGGSHSSRDRHAGRNGCAAFPLAST